jgi:hypothetical protein
MAKARRRAFMMSTAVRGAALMAVVVIATACTDATLPTAPTSRIAGNPTSALPDTPRGFPVVSRPARIYVAVNSPSYPMHGGPLASRYVLYDDGAFALQYSSANYPFFQYLGTYRDANDLITFEWEGWSVAGPWGATGSLSEESLVVRYNVIMQLTDFEDGVYLRAQ